MAYDIIFSINAGGKDDFVLYERSISFKYSEAIKHVLMNDKGFHSLDLQLGSYVLSKLESAIIKTKKDKDIIISRMLQEYGDYNSFLRIIRELSEFSKAAPKATFNVI